MQVEQLSGPDLAGYLLSLEPAGWDRSKAIIDRGPKSRVSQQDTIPRLYMMHQELGCRMKALKQCLLSLGHAK